MSEIERLLGEAVSHPVRPASDDREYRWPPDGYRPYNLPPIAASSELKPQHPVEVPPHLAARASEPLPPVAPRRLLDLPVIPGRPVQPKAATAPRKPVSDDDFRQSGNVRKARKLLDDPESALSRVCALLRADPQRTWTTHELVEALGEVRYGRDRRFKRLTPGELNMALSPARKRGWIAIERIRQDERAIGVRWLDTCEEA